MTRRTLLSFVAALTVAVTVLAGGSRSAAATPIHVRQTFSFDFAFDFCGPTVQGHDDVSYDTTLWEGDTSDATGSPILERALTHVNLTGTLSANGKTLFHSDNFLYHDPTITYLGPESVTLADGSTATGAHYALEEVSTGRLLLRTPGGAAVLVEADNTSYDAEVVLLAGQAPFYQALEGPATDVVARGRPYGFCPAIQRYLG